MVGNLSDGKNERGRKDEKQEKRSREGKRGEGDEGKKILERRKKQGRVKIGKPECGMQAPSVLREGFSAIITSGKE